MQMGEMQCHAVVVWGYSEEKKRIVVKVPRIFSAKNDALTFVRMNKVNTDTNTKWEVHTTVAEITQNFSFARDVPPNYK